MTCQGTDSWRGYSSALHRRHAGVENTEFQRGPTNFRACSSAGLFWQGLGKSVGCRLQSPWGSTECVLDR
jgi:hypothetical protein